VSFFLLSNMCFVTHAQTKTRKHTDIDSSINKNKQARTRVARAQ
jgi:hypothetical protein